jgi:hypothetical protein
MLVGDYLGDTVALATNNFYETQKFITMFTRANH